MRTILKEYIPNAVKPQDCLSNVQFQLANVEGWMSVKCLAAAYAKACCLQAAAEELVKSLEPHMHDEK